MSAPSSVQPTALAAPAIPVLDAAAELDRQVGVLLERGYPELVGLSP